MHINVSCSPHHVVKKQEAIPTKGTFQLRHGSDTTQPTGIEADTSIYVDSLINNSIVLTCLGAEKEAIPTKGDFQFRLGSRTTQPTGIEAYIYVDHSLIINSIDI